MSVVKVQKISREEAEYTDNMRIKEEVQLQIEFVKGLRRYIDEFIVDNEDYGPQVFGTIISATSATLVSFMKTVAEIPKDGSHNILSMMVEEAYKSE